MSTTCRALWHGLASSEGAWGTLEFTHFSNSWATKKMLRLLPWLARRRQGLRHLELDFPEVPKPECLQAAAQCLEGSPLVQLRLAT